MHWRAPKSPETAAERFKRLQSAERMARLAASGNLYDPPLEATSRLTLADWLAIAALGLFVCGVAAALVLGVALLTGAFHA